MLQISHTNLFVASSVFGDNAITSASGSGIPGRLRFLLAAGVVSASLSERMESPGSGETGDGDEISISTMVSSISSF